MDNRLLKVSSFPHIHTKRSSKVLMRDVLIALLPAVASSIYFYKLDAVIVFLATIAAGALSEMLWNKLTKGKFILEDCSAIITSILIALIMPSYIAPWIPAAGAVVAIILFKQCFGGLGQNFVNPAAAAKVFIIASWASLLSNPSADAASGASTNAYIPTLKEVFFGHAYGTIGEASILAILLGGIYLIARGIIDGKATLSYLASVAIFSLLISTDGFMKGDAINGLMQGNVFIVGIFMVNDFATTPINTAGKVIFGVFCGLLTVLFKVLGSNNEGAYYAVMVMNLFSRMIESLTIPKARKEAI